MAESIRHPFDTDAIYRLDPDGNVRVSRGDTFGIFSPAGVHLSGTLRHADPQLCVWVANDPGSAGQPVPATEASQYLRSS
jgi:hypothetical protein